MYSHVYSLHPEMYANIFGILSTLKSMLTTSKFAFSNIASFPLINSWNLVRFPTQNLNLFAPQAAQEATERKTNKFLSIHPWNSYQQLDKALKVFPSSLDCRERANGNCHKRKLNSHVATKQVFIVIHSLVDLFLKHKGKALSSRSSFHSLSTSFPIIAHVFRLWWDTLARIGSRIFQVHLGRNENKLCVTKRSNEISCRKLHHWKSIFGPQCASGDACFDFFFFSRSRVNKQIKKNNCAICQVIKRERERGRSESCEYI